ncbi:MAG: hypothetical protein Kapaf2KO_02820 [Candidatus Kapaibacteriales bacterium]
MKNLFLSLAIIGLILNITTMMPETLRGNILLWGDPARTTEMAFANGITSIFMYDLFYVVLCFLIWAVWDAKKIGIKHGWLIIIWTFVFGLAPALPYYLYQREKAKSLENDTKEK